MNISVATRILSGHTTDLRFVLSTSNTHIHMHEHMHALTPSYKTYSRKVWQMNRSAKRLLIITTSFSWTNHRRFVKLPNFLLAKFPTIQCKNLMVENFVIHQFSLLKLSLLMFLL